jgi:hypothetical protein
MARRCFRDKVALSLLGKNRESLKLKAISFEENNTQEQILSF